jgi:FkbM family methyltransferase
MRWVRWQLGSRLLLGSVVVPFVNVVRLLVQPGMTGATGNVYCGLHEFEDMALVLHALRADELLVDIGANVGSYTMLGAAAGARCLTIEPIPSTFAWLMRNVEINGLGDRVRALNLGLGRGEARLRFTGGRDTVNHVLAEGESADDAMEVPVRTLDAVLDGRSPTLIKMDVEGFESEVLAGAVRALADPGLLAVIIPQGQASRRTFGNSRSACRRSGVSRSTQVRSASDAQALEEHW